MEAGAWHTLTTNNAPVARVGHAQCASQDKLFIFGGRTSIETRTDFGSTAHLVHLDADFGSRPLNDLWQFEPASSKWTQLEPVGGEPPCPRSFHCAAAIDDTLYIFGGCGEDGRLADLHAFSLSERIWTELEPADLLGRGGATFEAAGNNSLWVAAGFVGHETRDLMRYDLQSAAWNRVNDTSWLRPRSVAASMSLSPPSGPTVVIFGGEVEPSSQGHEGAGGFANDTIAINGVSGAPIELTVEGESPEARGWAAATALSPTEGVLFGGLTGSDAEPRRLDDAWLLRLADL